MLALVIIQITRLKGPGRGAADNFYTWNGDVDGNTRRNATCDAIYHEVASNQPTKLISLSENHQRHPVMRHTGPAPVVSNTTV
jgi:hypothetical protein